MNWNQDNTLVLINMIRERPAIWDASSSLDPHNKLKKSDAVEEVARLMGISVKEVNSKWLGLRGQYYREKRKVTAAINSESCSATAPATRWFAYNEMESLMCCSNANTQNSFSNYLENNQNKQRPTCFVSVDREREVQKSKPHPQGDGQIRRIEAARIEKVAVNDRISIIKENDSGTQERDEYTAYGELVAMKLKKIGDSYARSTAQYHINNILYKAEIGEYDKPQRQSKSYKSREHIRTGSSSTPRHDSNYDEHSQISSSPTKSIDYNLKLENEDSDE